jgi:hypothetical protein
MVGALLIPDDQFLKIDMVAGMVIHQLLGTEERINAFKEFHAVDLFGGHGAFSGIDEAARYRAIRVLLNAVRMFNLKFVYSAIDKKNHALTAFGGGNPLDLTFRMCARGIEEILKEDEDSFWLLIMDDTQEKDLRYRLKTSFQLMRTRMLPPYESLGLWHCHDDMYFADSTDSLGIQISDLCNYFVSRKLRNLTDTENFLDCFSPTVSCAKVEPEWSHLGVFREVGDGK